MKKQYNISNIVAYLQGNIRYKLFYSKYSYLIPGYIKQQIKGRIKSMNRKCYNRGSCIMCGCQTTQLQMANKACEGHCYPKMVSRSKWKYMLEGNITRIGDELWQFQFGMFKNIVK